MPMPYRQFVRGFAAAILVLVLAAPLRAGAPDQPVGTIGPGDDLVRDRPGAEGLVRNGDETHVERLFVYLDGCPLVEVMRPEPGTGAPVVTMIAEDGEALACRPTRGAAAGVAPTLADGTAAMAEEPGLHVELLREAGSDAPETDVERLISPRGQTLVVNVSSIDPLLQTLIAASGRQLAGPVGPVGPVRPVGPLGRDAFAVPDMGGEDGARETTLAARRGAADAGFDPLLTSGRSNAGRGGSAGAGGGRGGSAEVAPIPAPATLAALSAALVVLGAVSVRRRRSKSALAAVRRGAVPVR